jgi:hypothetical protein
MRALVLAASLTTSAHANPLDTNPAVQRWLSQHQHSSKAERERQGNTDFARLTKAAESSSRPIWGQRSTLSERACADAHVRIERGDTT